MANRFPLVIDTGDGNKIKELPIGDNLNLDGAGIVNLSSLNVTGAISSGSLSSSTTLSVTGNASVGGTLSVTGTSTLTGNVTAGGNIAVTGNLSAATITLAGANLPFPLQSDWNETNSASLAFIRNKPTSFAPDNLDDIGDVFVATPNVNDVLTYDGFSWVALPPAGGIGLGDLSVVTNPASGSGSLLYNSGTGVFTFTPAVIPSAVSQLTNDSGYTTLAIVESQNYLQTGDVLSTGRITRSVASNQVTLGFDQTGLLTTVAVSGNISGDGTGANPIVLNDSISLGVINATSTVTASSFKDVTLDNLTFGLALSTTNGNITTTNGNIAATNGNVTGNRIIATTEVQASSIVNVGGTISLNGTKVQIQNNHFGIATSLTLPATPSVGDIAHTGSGVQTYVSDIDGAGTPGWIGLGGTVNFGRGLQIPVYVGGARPTSPRIGEAIWDDDVPNLKIWDGTSWLNIGP